MQTLQVIPQSFFPKFCHLMIGCSCAWLIVSYLDKDPSYGRRPSHHRRGLNYQYMAPCVSVRSCKLVVVRGARTMGMGFPIYGFYWIKEDAHNELHHITIFVLFSVMSVFFCQTITYYYVVQFPHHLLPYCTSDLCNNTAQRIYTDCLSTN